MAIWAPMLHRVWLSNANAYAFSCPRLPSMNQHMPSRGRFGPCSYCGFALAAEHRFKCSCGAECYCDVVCQARDWKHHKEVCSHLPWLRALRSLPLELSHKVIQLARAAHQSAHAIVPPQVATTGAGRGQQAGSAKVD